MVDAESVSVLVDVGSVATRECLDNGELGRGSSNRVGKRRDDPLDSDSLEELDARKLGGLLGA